MWVVSGRTKRAASGSIYRTPDATTGKKKDGAMAQSGDHWGQIHHPAIHMLMILTMQQLCTEHTGGIGPQI